MNQNQAFTLTIFSENQIGLLHRIAIVFSRRHLNIDSITASESEIPNIYRYTVLVSCSEEQVKKVVAQIEKLVEVLKAFYHPEEQVFSRELAMFKLPNAAQGEDLNALLEAHKAQIVLIDPEFIMIEKTGTTKAISQLHRALRNFRVLEFGCSGSVALTRPMRPLEDFLEVPSEFYVQ